MEIEKVNVQLQPVNSSNIKAAHFDAGTGDFIVQFSGGEVGRYSGVDEKTAQDFYAADSKGGFFAKNIRPNFAYTPVELGGVEGE